MRDRFNACCYYSEYGYQNGYDDCYGCIECYEMWVKHEEAVDVVDYCSEGIVDEVDEPVVVGIDNAEMTAVDCSMVVVLDSQASSDDGSVDGSENETMKLLMVKISGGWKKVAKKY